MAKNSVMKITNNEPLPHESIISLEVLEKLIDSYIPSPLLKSVDRSKINVCNNPASFIFAIGVLQNLLDNSNGELRMYGSAAELYRNLRIYHNFSLNHKKFGVSAFGMSELAVYESGPFVFESLSGKKFMRKLDCVLYIHAIASMVYMSKLCQPPDDVVVCMKKIEGRLENRNDYVVADMEMLDKIQQSLYETMNSSQESGESMFKQLPAHLDVMFRGLSKSLFPQPPPSKSSENTEKITHAKAIEKVAEKNPQLFLPYSDKDTNYPVVVRVFEDFGSDQFVMEAELFDNRIMRDHSKRHSMLTMKFDEVQKRFSNQIKNIEFIPVPIKTAKHAAVPIVTPYGDHCILASDALLEILRRMITALKVFHMFESSLWQKLTDFMVVLEAKFPADSKCKFFLDTKEFDKLKAATDEAFASDRTAKKEVRNVGRFGFTIEELKQELKNLEVIKAFPKIVDFAVQAYNLVADKKAGEFLRNCDMYDALEMCQLVCLLEKYPKLKKFLHSQQACCRVPIYKCPMCNPQSESVEKSDIEVFFEKDNGQNLTGRGVNWSMSMPDRRIIVTNYKFLSTEEILEEQFEYFLLDNDDLKWALESGKAPRLSGTMDAELGDVLKNLESFVKFRPNKKIYVREIPNGTNSGVFAEDVLKIIPILLKQQKAASMEKHKKQLDNYRKKWSSKNSDRYRLITTTEFNSILDEFEIEKSLVTILPDVYHDFTASQIFIDRSLYAGTFTPSGKPAMHHFSAFLDIFQSVVCGINWNIDACEKHPNCKQELKKQIIDEMTVYLGSESGSFVDAPCHESIIQRLQDHCTYKCQKKLRVMEFETPSHYNSEILVQDYNAVIKCYGLKNHLTKFIGQKTLIPIWMHRAGYVFGWCDSFFDTPELQKFHSFTRLAVISRFPGEILKENFEVLEAILDTSFSKTDLSLSGAVETKAIAEPTNPTTEKSSTEKLSKLASTITEEDKTEVEAKPINPSKSEKIKNLDTLKTSKDIPMQISDSNADTCKKSMETFNEAEEEVLEKTLKEKNAELEMLRMHEEKSKKLDESDMKMKDLEKEAEEPEMKHLKILEENVKMGNMLKSTENQKALEIQVKEKDEQLKVVQKALDDKDRKLGKLEKILKEKDEEIYDLSESEKSLNQEKGDFKAAVNRLMSQLVDKDKEIGELKKASSNAGASKIEGVEKLKQASSELEKKVNVGLEQLKVKDSKILELEGKNSKLTKEKDLEIEKLKKQQVFVAKEAKKEIEQMKRSASKSADELKVKDSKIRELELKNSKLIQEKNAEIEKLKKEQSLAANDNKKEIEQLKRNASKSADEIKKLTSKISDNETAENLLKRSNKGLLEKLRKSESSLQEITNRRSHLEAEVAEKNRLILELTNFAEKQVSEQEKAKKELETRISKIRGMLDEILPPEPKPEPVPSENSENLSIQKLKTLFNAPGPIELAKEMVEKLISLSNRPEIHQMARYELQQYQGKVENYLRELERKTEKISEFPSFSDRFMSEYWKEIDKIGQIALSDTECLICFDEMKFDEEPTLKCEQCRKIVHHKCASKWLKIYRSCAHCRQEMLDPDEFPSLQ